LHDKTAVSSSSSYRIDLVERRLGFSSGDIIASIDGVPVETVADATAQFEKNGSETRLDITRAGTPLSIVVK
jgi:C-terminal processing protease CtpA/Prc